MRQKTGNLLLCALFCAFLLGMLLLFLLLPRQDFSPREKRFLAQAPRLRAEEVFSGRFGREAESWCSDHLPGRDFFVGLNARALYWSNLQVTRPVYPGRSGRLYEAPAAYDEAVIARNMDAINAFARDLGQELDLMLVPSAGFVLQEDIAGLADPYPDDRIIARAGALAGEQVQLVDLLPLFRAQPDPGALYYRTDHHWTSRGAWLAAGAYVGGDGRSLPPEEAYRITRVEGFQGSTYARACFWDLPAESLELWDSGGQFQVLFSDREESADRLFFPQRLEEADKYPVWLDGNHPLVRIRNLSPEARGSILVIRDSFANCMGCFLADAYAEVTMVDLRYYKLPVSALCRETRYDRVLVLYSVGNFMSDGNLPWLE